MNAIRKTIVRFLRSQDGPTATEYAVMIALICVAVIGALSSFGVHMDAVYASLASTIPVSSGS
jgi:pilus assembly protein Flp/PilA